MLVFPLTLAVAVVIPFNVLYHLAYLWGWLLAASWLWVRYQGPRIELKRELRSDWAQVGDELAEHWVLYNPGSLPLLWVEISDASTLPGYTARRVAATTPQSVQHWTTSAISLRRGRYRLGPLAIELADPLGLFRYRRAEAGTREMLIYPPLVHLPALERPRGQRGGVASAALLNIFPTPSAGSIRDYRPGDPLNFVHWPALAHTGKLMVKEFDQEVAGAVWIILDLYGAVHSGSGTEATEELGVVLACSLANLMLAEGRSVGFFAHGKEPYMVQPNRGRQHVWEFMSVLVDVYAEGEVPLRAVIDEFRFVVPGRHAAAVITPDASGDWIGPLTMVTGGGNAAQALLVDTAVPRLGPLATRLGMLGVPHSSFRVGEPLPLLTPLRERAPTYRISPLGRAVHLES
jgi:uncharacterized protein (DUF58 family)